MLLRSVRDLADRFNWHLGPVPLNPIAAPIVGLHDLTESFGGASGLHDAGKASAWDVVQAGRAWGLGVGGTALAIGAPIGKGIVASGTLKRNPKIYTVAFEVELPKALYPGIDIQYHFREANKVLLATMDADAEFAAAMEGLIPHLRQMITTRHGSVGWGSPKGWVWHHHADRVGILQLVPKSEHTFKSPFWYTLHPGGKGGMSQWGR